MKNNYANIMIVEDELIVSMEVEHQLKFRGYNVVYKAFNSEKAIEAAQKFSVDVILMDINIKGSCDGILTSKEILKISSPSIIFISAYNDNETKERIKSIHPTYFLPKPFTHSELNSMVQKVLAEKVS